MLVLEWVEFVFINFVYFKINMIEINIKGGC